MSAPEGLAAPAGGDDAAIEALRAACAREPGKAQPLIRLARALLAARRAAEAVVPAEQAVALAPQVPAALQIREQVLAAVLAGDPELVRLELAAALEGANAEAQLSLGEAYAALDRPHDAERQFKRALALGRVRDASADLASLYLSVGMADAAEHYARAVLAAPDAGAADDLVVAMAHQTLASLADARGDRAGADAELDQAYGRRSFFRQQVSGCPFTTLVLVTRTAGNIPYKALLPPLRSDCVVWYMEHARLEQLAEIDDYAVVLNAIGDPDLAIASAEVVDQVVWTTGKPVMNRPERVRATFRHVLPATLAGIENVLGPPTVRLTAAEIGEGGLAPAAARAGLAAPVLVRPVGSHGGAGLVLAADAEALAATQVPPGADAYLTAYVDYRSPDGFFRKYRMIFVDRRPHPYHLAIGRHWMVHHQSTDMATDPARIAEEMAFLSDPAAAIGETALAAVAAIGARLDLDYGGVDFTLTADGRVLVFEANATMLTHLEPEDGPFAAKNPHIRPIMEAFQAHLAAVAGWCGGTVLES